MFAIFRYYIEYINDEESFTPFTEYKFAIKKEFIDLLLKTSLNEGKTQIQSIRNGLEEVIPFCLLKLL